ncbi:hypothetical protein [Sorangium sp. So ce1078]|uniref:hypothetical protein n=1 Tax=Sorangium sp. So ce1078 TaxID=3133329 RepID=UPI003F602170
MKIYRIPGLLVSCLGLSIAGGGAGCAVSGGDAPSLDGPPVSVRAAGTGSSTAGPATTGPATTGPAGDLVGSWADAVQGVYGNGLSAEALTRNALITNVRANPVMVSVPLATESYADVGGEPELRFQLRHEPTREVMRYLVSCALEQDQSVSYTDTSTGEEHAFRGEIGICPHWATGPVGPKCRQLITACVLARVNALGRNVTLSMRGQAFPEDRPGLLTPASSVRVVTVTEDGDAIPSFARCKTEISGESRDCGWTAGHIGSCTPGSHVYIGVGSEPLGDCDADPSSATGLSPGDTVVRLCSGIRGCDAGSPDHIDPSEVRCSGRSEPALHFVCPASGHFSVMNGPRTTLGAGAAGPAKILAATLQQHKRFSVTSHVQPGPTPPPGAVSIIEASFKPAEYPAPEARVFRWREGAFYGSFWGENPLNGRLEAGMNEVTEDGEFHGAPASGQSVFRHAFACTGEYWTDQAAYVEHRLCAGAGEEKDCAATSVGACGDAHAFKDCPPLDQCSVADGGLVEGDGDFQECKGSGGGTWHHPITVYLNHPSDVIRNSPFARMVSGALFVDAPLCP